MAEARSFLARRQTGLAAAPAALSLADFSLLPRAVRDEPARLFKSHHPDYADGGQLRDFIRVGDCVAVMLWLLDHPATRGALMSGSGSTVFAVLHDPSAAKNLADEARAALDPHLWSWAGLTE